MSERPKVLGGRLPPTWLLFIIWLFCNMLKSLCVFLPSLPVFLLCQTRCWPWVAFPGSEMLRPGLLSAPNADLLGCLGCCLPRSSSGDLGLIKNRSWPSFVCGSWLPVWSQCLPRGVGLHFAALTVAQQCIPALLRTHCMCPGLSHPVD